MDELRQKVKDLRASFPCNALQKQELNKNESYSSPCLPSADTMLNVWKLCTMIRL
ncbi:hypothetical protein FEM48_Zijuj07G0056800 [Ziziphus jujuba var. spinosa]|uniref:Uncharacterized protein n=1 Tax=Ziziphus jujuba var. spinosa TaxID=714518 RepID=A0A978V2S9_ZIZJJ|nr:hypothetical protein FEM48_Zijuj07G0056800 [Ziziphus jujuba var. spinosa]